MSLVQRFLTAFRESDTLEPGLFQKPDGTVWLRNPDGSESQVGSGGSQPEDEATYSLSGTLTAGTSGSLSLTYGDGNADLLDLTDPTAPVAAAPGDYAVTVSFTAFGTNPGDTDVAQLTLYANSAVGTATAAATQKLVDAATSCLASTWYEPDGGAFNFYANAAAGVDTSFSGTVLVRKLS